MCDNCGTCWSRDIELLLWTALCSSHCGNCELWRAEASAVVRSRSTGIFVQEARQGVVRSSEFLEVAGWLRIYVHSSRLTYCAGWQADHAGGGRVVAMSGQFRIGSAEVKKSTKVQYSARARVLQLVVQSTVHFHRRDAVRTRTHGCSSGSVAWRRYILSSGTAKVQ